MSEGSKITLKGHLDNVPSDELKGIKCMLRKTTHTIRFLVRAALKYGFLGYDALQPDM